MNYVKEAGGLYGQNLVDGMSAGIIALHNWASGCPWHIDSISYAVPFAAFNVAAFVALLPFAFTCCRRCCGRRRRRQALVGVFAVVSAVVAVMSVVGVVLYANDSLTDEAEFIKRGGACRDSHSSTNVPGSVYIASTVYSLFLLIAALVTCCTKRRPLRFLATDGAPVSVFPKNRKPSKSVLGGILSLTGLVSAGISAVFLCFDCQAWRFGFTCCLALGCFFVPCGCVALPFSRKDFHSSTSYAPLFVACLTLAAVCHCLSWGGVAVAFAAIDSVGSGGAGLGDSAKMWMGVYHSGNFTIENYNNVCDSGGTYLVVVSVLLASMSAAYLISLAVLYYQFVRPPLSDSASEHEDDAAEADGAPEDAEGPEADAENLEEEAPPVDHELGVRFIGASGLCLALSGIVGAVISLIFCFVCSFQSSSLICSLVLGLLLTAAGAPASALLRWRTDAIQMRLMPASVGLIVVCVIASLFQLLIIIPDLKWIEDAARYRMYLLEESILHPYAVEPPDGDGGVCETRWLFLTVFCTGTFGQSLVHLIIVSFCYHYFKKQRSLVVTAEGAPDAVDEHGGVAAIDSGETADDDSAGKKTPANEADDDSAGKKTPANEAVDDSAGKKTPANEADDDSAGKKTPANEADDDSAGKKTPANEADDDSAGKKTPANEADDDSVNSQ